MRSGETLSGRSLEEALCSGDYLPRSSGKKIGWLHVAKTGTSFLTTVVHHACAGLPPSFSVAALVTEEERLRASLSAAEQQKANALMQQSNVWAVLDQRYNVTAACFEHDLLDRGRAVTQNGATVGWRNHVPVEWSRDGDHKLAALFRAPTQRLLSAFHHDGAHGPLGATLSDRSALRAAGVAAYARYCPGVCSSLADTSTLAAAAAGAAQCADPASAARRAAAYSRTTRCVANKQCSFLLGRACTSLTDAHLAADRLSKFAFVGLTEHFNASVCLFHRQLGGEPLPVEFEASRQHQGDAKRSGWYDDTELRAAGVDEAYDEVVYAEARRLFVRLLSNVTGWRCAIHDHHERQAPLLTCARAE